MALENRAGNLGVFFLNPDGSLVTAGGIPVAGVSGPPKIPPNTSPDQISVNEDGAIRVDGNEVGRLKMVAFENEKTLRLDGALTFAASKASSISEATSRVRQGYRELSNVSATHELIKLITGVRHHEAAQRVIRSMSDTLQQRTRPR